MTLDLEIPTITPGLNTFMGRSRWAYQAAQKRWQGLVWQAWLEATLVNRAPLAWPRPPDRHVLVEIERITNRTPLDDDNFRGGLKVVIDALKGARLIGEDDVRTITVTATQTVLVPLTIAEKKAHYLALRRKERAPVRMRTRIRLEER